jgi:hypothetical protein
MKREQSAYGFVGSSKEGGEGVIIKPPFSHRPIPTRPRLVAGRNR